MPLPPLPTQHKIVEILEEADNLRKLRRQADEKMKDLIPSLFVQMFGDPETNPKGWKIKKLGGICEFVYGDSLPERKRNNGIVAVYSSNGIVGKHDIAISEGETIIIGRKGSVGEVNFSCEPCFPIDTTYFIDKRYTKQNLAWLFCLLKFLKLEKLSLMVGVPGLNRNHAYDISVILPPLPLQQEFAKLVEDIEAEKARQAESRKKLDELFQCLMQRAFTGELVA
jgi:type I restriction enzyme S subunit